MEVIVDNRKELNWFLIPNEMRNWAVNEQRENSGILGGVYMIPVRGFTPVWVNPGAHL